MENKYQEALNQIMCRDTDMSTQEAVELLEEAIEKAKLVDSDMLYQAKATLIKENEQQKRVLDILKSKRVDVDLICDFIEQYGELSLQTYNGEITCFGMHECMLTPEEYDILKAWLNDK